VLTAIELGIAEISVLAELHLVEHRVPGELRPAELGILYVAVSQIELVEASFCEVQVDAGPEGIRRGGPEMRSQNALRR
jgi:hypothetical protein